MKTEKLITLEEAHALLQPMVGALAWFVRSSADRILRIEFGEPHLSVNEIGRLGSTENRAGTVSRRMAFPTGQWSLFVEDGDWRIQADAAQAARFGADTSEEDRCFALLSGQKLDKFSLGQTSPLLVLEFDLGGRLIVDTHVDFETNSQWMVFFENGAILASEADGSFVLEDRKITGIEEYS